MKSGFESVPLGLSYKGERDYLHGSDIFQALSEWARATYGENVFVSRLSFRHLARSHCTVTTEPLQSSLAGEGKLIAQGAAVPFWLAETGQPVQERYAYDEDAVVAPLIMDADSRQAVLPAVTASPIEEVIAVTKKLSNQVAPLSSGKWLFGQLQLNEPLTREGRPLRIVMRSLLASRFSINDIYYGERLIGNIRFVAGEA